MRRVDLIGLLRFAGYHGNKRDLVRLYVENSITWTKAQKAYLEGERARGRGVRCDCHECAKRPEEKDPESLKV